MNTVDKHNVWELNVTGFPKPVLASYLIAYMSSDTNNEEIAQSLLKSYIAKVSTEGKVYATCGTCDCPVHFIAKNATAEAHFRHISSRAPDDERLKLCSFYTGTESFFGSGSIYVGEGKWHFDTKHALAHHIESISEYHNVAIEKFIFSKDPNVDARRKPDISFQDSKGNKFVIELTRWWMNPETVHERERFFREQGINLIWLFSPTCSESNATTLNMILYGSPASREDACPDVLSKVECNAFVLTDEAWSAMRERHTVVFDTLYPMAVFDKESQSVVIEKHSQLVELSQLKLSPHQRLPFAIRTSDSFKTALNEKNRNDRLRKLEAFRKLRSLAYRELRFESDSDDVTHNQAIDIAFTLAHTATQRRHVERYAKKAHKNILNAKMQLAARSARTQAAANIRNYRKNVRSILLTAMSTSYEQDVLKMKARLRLIVEQSAKHHSAGFSSFLHRAMSKIELKLDGLKQLRDELNQSQKVAKENHVKEMQSFIVFLKNGFDDVRSDADTLRIKKSRIVYDAHRHGFPEEADHLESLFKEVMSRTQWEYWAREYPSLVQGWKPDLRYKPDLDKALSLWSRELHRRDPEKKQVDAYRAHTNALLKMFTDSLKLYVETVYLRLVETDQPTLSSLPLNDASNLVRLRSCADYMKSKRLDVPNILFRQLDIIELGIDMLNQGSSPLDVGQQLKQAHLALYG